MRLGGNKDILTQKTLSENEGVFVLGEYADDGKRRVGRAVRKGTNVPKQLHMPPMPECRKPGSDRRSRANDMLIGIREIDLFSDISDDTLYKIIYYVLFINGLQND